MYLLFALEHELHNDHLNYYNTSLLPPLIKNTAVTNGTEEAHSRSHMNISYLNILILLLAKNVVFCAFL